MLLEFVEHFAPSTRAQKTLEDILLCGPLPIKRITGSVGASSEKEQHARHI